MIDKIEQASILVLILVLTSCQFNSSSGINLIEIGGVNYYSAIERLEVHKQSLNSTTIKLEGNKQKLECRFYVQNEKFTSKLLRRLPIKNMECSDLETSHLNYDTTYTHNGFKIDKNVRFQSCGYKLDVEILNIKKDQTIVCISDKLKEYELEMIEYFLDNLMFEQK